MTQVAHNGSTSMSRVVLCPKCKKGLSVPLNKGTLVVDCPICTHKWEWTPYLRQTTSPVIAVIGTEGSGKTVLTTTLAKRLSTIDASGVFLNPDIKTLKYVEGVWHTLQSGDWPPSTPPGELFELKWKFQVIGEMECDVRLIDSPGQDLRQLFGGEQILANEPLPTKHMQLLAEYCRAADIILFLINLKDFIGQGDPKQRTDNQAAMKAAMDYLGGESPPRRVCLVLTQMDSYREDARKRGGWLELAAEAIPYVFGAHVRIRQVAVHPVSAVADTQVVVDPDGIPRRKPIAGFQSEGLNEVVAWLTTQVREVKRELDQEAEAATKTPPPSVPLPPIGGSFDTSSVVSDGPPPPWATAEDKETRNKQLLKAREPFEKWGIWIVSTVGGVIGLIIGGNMVFFFVSFITGGFIGAAIGGAIGKARYPD